jgi:D-xylose transport system permease protein
MQNWLRQVRAGDLGQLPIILGLVVISIVFQSQNANFLTPNNFVNLIIQAAIFTTIGYGVVIILLLGEIDLSMGYVAGVSAVVTARLLERPVNLDITIRGFTLVNIVDLVVPWYLAISAALLAALLIGALQGWIITTFRLPSFIVTIAGQLAWSGAVLLLMGGAGTVLMRDATVLGITSSFFSPEQGWIFGIVVIALFVGVDLITYATRRASGLAAKPLGVIVMQGAAVTALVLAFVYVCNLSRGVPFIAVLLLVMLVALTYLTTQTRFGRYLFAVGGNKEAARRAGINVERIRVYGFMLGSLMAGIGGIILASRLRSVAPDAGGGQLLLNSIAAAVIGGTSLFGGSGRISSALFGALVIASVDNGMFLLGLGAGQRLILTAGVLLLAVTVDSVARRNQQRAGIR